MCPIDVTSVAQCYPTLKCGGFRHFLAGWKPTRSALRESGKTAALQSYPAANSIIRPLRSAVNNDPSGLMAGAHHNAIPAS